MVTLVPAVSSWRRGSLVESADAPLVRFHSPWNVACRQFAGQVSTESGFTALIEPTQRPSSKNWHIAVLRAALDPWFSGVSSYAIWTIQLPAGLGAVSAPRA